MYAKQSELMIVMITFGKMGNIQNALELFEMNKNDISTTDHTILKQTIMKSVIKSKIKWNKYN